MGQPEDQRWAVLEAARDTAQLRRDRAQDRLAQATAMYQPLLAEIAQDLPITQGKVDPTAVKRYREAMADLVKLEALTGEAESAYVQACANCATFAEWETRSQELSEQLHAEYSGHGPQYEILIRRLVQAEMHARQLETTGQVSSGEYERATNSVMKLVQALQKYTEENASVRKAINEAVLQALATIEPEIKGVAPQAWQNAMVKLRLRLMGSEVA